MSDRPPNLIHLDFEPEAYRRASALITAYSFNDRKTVAELLSEPCRDLACALLICLYSAVARTAEIGGTSFTEELQELAIAAVKVAAEEGAQ